MPSPPTGISADSPPEAPCGMDVEMITPSQYCELALSNRKLQRSDKRHPGLRGLIDPVARKVYLVAEERLYDEA